MDPEADVRSESTFFLAAAAHRDPAFAESITQEFLAEPRRAIPPSPGIDAPTVLAEAASAQFQSMVRTVSIAALLLLIAFVGNPLVLLWLVVGGAIGAFTSFTSATKSKAGSWAAVAMVIVFLLLAYRSMTASMSDALTADDSGSAASSTLPTTLTFVGVIVVYLVLVVDGFATEQAITHWLSRVTGLTEQETNWAKRVRRRTLSVHRKQLARVRAVGQRADVVVHRGWNTFVGSGQVVKAWAIVIQLKPEDGPQSPIARFEPIDIYNRVAAGMHDLVGSSTLSPGQRLGGLTDQAQLITSDAELLTHRLDGASGVGISILPDLNNAPMQTVTDPGVFVEVANTAPEWVRYYRCFRVEAWDGQLVVSGFLHVGCDDTNLYLEWTACALRPLLKRYRSEVEKSSSLLRVFGSALIRTLRAPIEVLYNFPRTVHVVNGTLSDSTLDSTEPGPGVHGAEQSLREMASGTKSDHYFQEIDIQRYVSLMDKRVLASVRRFLEERKISTVEFESQSSTIINNTTLVSNSQITGSNIGSHGSEASQSGADNKTEESAWQKIQNLGRKNG